VRKDTVVGQISSGSTHNFARIAGLVAMALFALCSIGAVQAQAIKCGGKKATIVGGKGDNVIKAPKKGPQVIHGRGGNDVIIAKRGKDTVCGGSGNDVISGGTGTDKVLGGSGNDFIHLGPGRDKAVGGGGADIVFGGAGGDKIRGGSGEDRLFGGIQDDKMFGDAGVDLLAGGQGIDKMRGGAGDDWLRGDPNRDRYFGDAGSDTLSFASATPPGPHPTRGGVDVYLGPGWARGDDAFERIFGIENLVGSFFRDRLNGAGVGSVDGLIGPDECTGFAVQSCDGDPTPGPLVMIANPTSPDPGLVLIGGNGSDNWTIQPTGGTGYRVSGSAATAGTGCTDGGGQITCQASRPIGYMLAWGDDGNDSINIGNGFPAPTLLKADGGPGDDVLNGSNGEDILWAGESGSDVLVGNGGDDALVSRAGGGDRLFGGKGNDQLVTNDPCSDHLFNGGSGKADVAGFAHTDTRGVIARVGGRGKLRGAGCPGTRIRGNNEVLEGTRFPDVLIASHRFDLLIGREGKDRCKGGRKKSC
jgi:Ca2+-binding RTX toxin-like protein